MSIYVENNYIATDDDKSPIISNTNVNIDCHSQIVHTNKIMEINPELKLNIHYEWMSNDLTKRLIEYEKHAINVCADEHQIIITRMFPRLVNDLCLKRPECMEIEIFKNNPHYWMSVLSNDLERLNTKKKKLSETLYTDQTADVYSEHSKLQIAYTFLNTLFCSGGSTYGSTILSYEYKQYDDILQIVNSMTLIPSKKESPQRKNFLRSFFLQSSPKSLVGFIGTHLETTSNSPDVCKPMSSSNTPFDIFVHCLRVKLEYLINTPTFIERYDTFEFNGRTAKLSDNIDQISKKIPIEIDMVALNKAIYFELTPETEKTAIKVGNYSKLKPITDNLVILASSSILLKIFLNEKSSATALLRIVLGKEIVFDNKKINPNDIYAD